MSGSVGVGDALAAEDLCARGEVRTFDSLGNGGKEFLGCGRGVSEVPQRRIGNFSKVVGWDVGRHSHRDTDRSVDQKVGESARED